MLTCAVLPFCLTHRRYHEQVLDLKKRKKKGSKKKQAIFMPLYKQAS